MILSLLVFAASVVVLVGLHEAGHFFVARAFGVYIKEFAIGFGPKLFAVQGKETRYSLRLIPLGGYVRMAGEDRLETEESVPSDRVLYNKPPYVRALISLAGPFANLLLAFCITLIVVWSVAFPVLQVAGVVPASPAEEALHLGDRVLEINGRRILAYEQIPSAVAASEGRPVRLLVERSGDTLELTVEPEYIEEEGRFVLGGYFAAAAFTHELALIDFTSPLARHGVRVGDRIISVNGESTETFVALQIAVDAALPAQSVRLTILRNGELFEVTLSTDAMTVFDVFAGVEFTDLGIEYQRAGFTEGIALSSRQFVGYIQALVSVVRSVVAGQVEADEVFQGPVGVAQVLGESLRVGASYFFQLLAFLSLNFGLINLIPFPALDGSRAVFALYEWVRRKPIPPQREGIIHAIGFLILIGLMILITYQDIARLFG